jgi:phosphate transport system protein
VFDTPDNLNRDLPGGQIDTTDRKILLLKRRLIREATFAISMLENSLKALFALDLDAAQSVRLSDDNVDSEEVLIEQQCQQLLALHHPFGRAFRSLIFILKVNAELERVADHATSIAKQVPKIASALPPGASMPWPTSLTELAERVPALCHQLMRAVLDEDVQAARDLVRADKIIDELEKRLFEETAEMVQNLKWGDNQRAPLAIGLLVYRIGRELERVGDLMASVAEDVVYVATGEIIRHEKRRQKAAQQG